MKTFTCPKCNKETDVRLAVEISEGNILHGPFYKGPRICLKCYAKLEAKQKARSKGE